MKRTRAFQWTITTLVLVVLVYGVSWKWGRGGYGEFSPDTLEARSYGEILLPLTEVPIYQSEYTYSRQKLTTYLVDKGYWVPQQHPNPRWVPIVHWNEQWRDGDSTFHKLLHSRRDYWMKWTEAHPDIAAVYWPDLLRRMRASDDVEADAFLFHMIELVRNVETPEQYEELLRGLTKVDGPQAN